MHVFVKSGFETRLMNEIREKRGLAYGCGASIISDNYINAVFGVTATNTQNVEQVIQIIKDEFKKFIEHGITDEEFEFHRSYLVGRSLLNLDSSFDINQAIIFAVAHGIDPKQYMQGLSKKYKEMTRKNVLDAISKHMKVDELTFVVTGR